MATTAKNKSSAGARVARSKPKSARNASAKRVVRKAKAAATKKVVAKKKVAAKREAPMNAAAKKAAQLADHMSMASLSPDAFRDMFATGSVEAQKAQDKIMAISREGAQQMARQADAASQSMTEAMALGKDNVEACMACSNIAVGVSKSMGAEWINYANKSLAQNVELSKEIFNCRTLNDVFDLQTKFVKSNMDSFFNESVKLSELAFRTASEMADPFNDRINQAAETFRKAMAA